MTSTAKSHTAKQWRPSPHGDISAKRLPKIFIVFHVIILCLSMVVTPKKVIRSDLLCFLCASTLGKDRVRIFGKSSLDIPGLIKSAGDIDVTEFSSSDLFICAPHCYRRLLRFGKLSSTFLALKDEIKKDFDKDGLRTKCLRKDSTAEEGFVAEKLQHESHVSHEESSQQSSARSGGAAKSLKFPAIQPGSCTPSRFPTTCTSLYGQGTVGPVVDFRFLVSPPEPSQFLTSTPKRHSGYTVSSRKPSEPSTAGVYG